MRCWKKASASKRSGYSKTFTNCFPGICRTIPFISISQSAARTSEEDNSDFSTSSSTCTASSTPSRPKMFFSWGESASANKDARSARDVPWNSINFAAKFHPQARGDQRARILRPLHDHHAQRNPRDDPVAHREILGSGMRAKWKLTDQRAAFFDFAE